MKRQFCSELTSTFPFVLLQGRIRTLFLLEEETEEWHDDFLSEIAGPLPRVFVASEAVIKKVAGLESATGRVAAAEIEMPREVSHMTWSTITRFENHVLVLVGTILYRMTVAALCAGLHARDRKDMNLSTALKTSSKAS